MSSEIYDAVVVGAGPGGLAAVCALLDGGLGHVKWVDRDFNGGRLNGLYREISSNTKVGIYLDAITSSDTCRRIIADTPTPHAVTRLEALDRESTCELSLAGDMVMLLTQGLVQLGVEQYRGEVERATLEDGHWRVDLAGDTSTPLGANRLVLATGAHPSPASFHREYNADLEVLDLDRCMVKSTLPDLLPNDRKSTIAIIGNSHSGVLVCRNLYEIAESSGTTSSQPPTSPGHRNISIINFQRSPIRYADYRDDGIVYDNTGLKGSTADWAKATMEDRADDDRLRQVKLGEDEEEVYREYLPRCTHIVYAIGYTRSPIPPLWRMTARGKERIDGRVDGRVEFDMYTSGFRIPNTRDGDGRGRDGGDEEDGKMIPGLYGCGIAFPEEVEDPEGHVEAAVGLAKFFKFAERVKGTWVDATG